MRIMRVAGLALALGAAATANAQEAGHGADVPPFAELDVDRDGYVTEAEASRVPAVIEVFTELDGNGDARLDAEEYGKLAQTR